MGIWGTEEMVNDIFGKEKEKISKEQLHQMKIDLMRKYAENIRSYHSGSFYIKGDIPSKKINNAIATFAVGLDRNTIIGFYDLTVFGSGKEGMVFADHAIYYNTISQGMGKWVYSDIDSVENLGRRLHMKNGEYIEVGIGDYDYVEMGKFLNEMLELDKRFENKQNKVKTKAEWMQRYGAQMADGFSFYFQGAIPDKTLNAAISSYAYGVAKKEVIGLFDTTLFNNGKQGYVFTEDAVYQNVDSDNPHKLKYDDISNVVKSSWRGIKIEFKDGTVSEEIEPDYLKIEPFISFLKQMANWEG